LKRHHDLLELVFTLLKVEVLPDGWVLPGERGDLLAL
jgi:hypothetical protein